MDRLEISVSVLSPSSPIDCRSEQDLLAQLLPGVDGLILVDGARLVPRLLDSPAEVSQNLVLAVASKLLRAVTFSIDSAALALP